MSYQELLATVIAREVLFDSARRAYIVSDRIVYVVTPHAELERTRRVRRRRLDPRYVAAPQPPTKETATPPLRTLCIGYAIRERSDGDFVEWDDLTGQELVKVAELRHMVDDWKSGKLAELPPSTATDPRDIEDED